MADDISEAEILEKHLDDLFSQHMIKFPKTPLYTRFYIIETAMLRKHYSLPLKEQRQVFSRWKRKKIKAKEFLDGLVRSSS